MRQCYIASLQLCDTSGSPTSASSAQQRGSRLKSVPLTHQQQGVGSAHLTAAQPFPQMLWRSHGSNSRSSRRAVMPLLPLSRERESGFLVPNPWNDAFLIIAFYYALPLDHQELRHFQKEYNDFLAKSSWLRKTTADDILNLWQPSVRPYPATKFLCKWLNPKATKSTPNESPRQIHSLRREGWGQFKIVLVETSHY